MFAKRKLQKSLKKAAAVVVESLERRDLFSALQPATNVQATAIGAHTAAITFNNNGGADYFEYRHWDQTLNNFGIDGTVAGNATSAVDSNLPPGANTVYVIARTYSGGQAWSPTDLANVWISGGLQAATNVQATAIDSHSAAITFNNNGGADCYQKFHWGPNGFVNDGTVPGNATSAVDSNLSPGANTVYIIAMTYSGGQAWGSTDLANVWISGGLQAATNVQATAIDAHSAAITFNNNGGADYYQKFHWGQNGFVNDGTVPGNATSAVDSNLSPGANTVYIIAMTYSGGQAWSQTDLANVYIPNTVAFSSGQQFTANEEGLRLNLYHPTSGSGVTIGYGYDMLSRSSTQILSELTGVGVSSAAAARFAAGAGLSGSQADSFVQVNSGLAITSDQAKLLFLNDYASKASYAQALATKADVVVMYGYTNWTTLNQKIKDILIDMTFRGDYTPTVRTYVQRYVVANDLAGLQMRYQTVRFSTLPYPPAAFTTASII